MCIFNFSRIKRIKKAQETLIKEISKIKYSQFLPFIFVTKFNYHLLLKAHQTAIHFWKLKYFFEPKNHVKIKYFFLHRKRVYKHLQKFKSVFQSF